MDTWNPERLHDFILERARQIVPEAEHAPLLILIDGHEHVHVVSLARVMGRKNLAAVLMRAEVKRAGARMAATIMEGWAVSRPPEASLDGLCPSQEPDRQEVLVITIEEPGSTTSWSYRIEHSEGGNRALGGLHERPTAMDYNRFALFEQAVS